MADRNSSVRHANRSDCSQLAPVSVVAVSLAVLHLKTSSLSGRTGSGLILEPRPTEEWGDWPTSTTGGRWSVVGRGRVRIGIGSHCHFVSSKKERRFRIDSFASLLAVRSEGAVSRRGTRPAPSG